MGGAWRITLYTPAPQPGCREIQDYKYYNVTES